MARAALASGKCAVIGLQSTGEARTADVVAEKGEQLDDFVSGEQHICWSIQQRIMFRFRAERPVYLCAACGMQWARCARGVAPPAPTDSRNNNTTASGPAAWHRPVGATLHCSNRLSTYGCLLPALLVAGPKELLLRLVDLHFPLPPDPDAPEDEDGAWSSCFWCWFSFIP